MGVADILFPRGVQRVLASVLLEPETEFRHTELVARAGSGRGGGQNAIRSLLESGIAMSRRSGNQVLVSANRNHPLFGELRSICLKTFGIADLTRAALQPWSDRIELAFVLGEAAGGVGSAGGPLRLIVVGRPDVLTIRSALGALEGSLGRTVDLNVYDSLEWQTLKEGPWMAGALAGPKTMVKGDDPAPLAWADPQRGPTAPAADRAPDPRQVAQLVAEAESLLADGRARSLSPIGRYRLARASVVSPWPSCTITRSAAIPVAGRAPWPCRHS